MLVEMEAIGIKRVLAHSEKPLPTWRMAMRGEQEAGAMHGPIGWNANLASGLQDPYLGLSPVIALTEKSPSMRSIGTPIRRSFTHPI